MHPHDRDQELQRVTLPEHADDEARTTPYQPHEHELPHTGEAPLGRRAPHTRAREHAGGDEELVGDRSPVYASRTTDNVTPLRAE
jgi:hypothetical protein